MYTRHGHAPNWDSHRISPARQLGSNSRLITSLGREFGVYALNNADLFGLPIRDPNAMNKQDI